MAPGQAIREAKHWLFNHAAPAHTRRRRALHYVRQFVRFHVLAPALACDPVNVYGAAALDAFLEDCAALPLGGTPAEAETGASGAARFVLRTLQDSPSVRRKFPRGLADGVEGAYCRWLCCEEARRLGLSHQAIISIRQAFAAQPGERIRQVFDHHADVRHLFPLALTPAGQRPFARWLLRKRMGEYRLRDEEVLWFLFESAEDVDCGLTATFLRTPSWQQRFPCGLTVFGREAFLEWLRQHYRIVGAWLERAAWEELFQPLDELRLLYNSRPDLRRQVPAAFANKNATRRLAAIAQKELAGPDTPPAAWWSRLENELADQTTIEPGLNVLGHFCHVSGQREALLATVRSLQRAAVRTSRRDVPAFYASDLRERAGALGLEMFDYTLIQMAPEPFLGDCYPRSGLAPRQGTYRIALWYWELESVPRRWARYTRLVQEVWAPTRFIAEAMRRALPLPVIDMAPGVELGTVAPLSRRDFGLPEDCYLFLAVFDMRSIMERKNPLAVLRAYQKAFGLDKRVALAFKVTHGDLDRPNLERLRREAGAVGATVLDRVMGRAESYAFLNACDCYVSLHRSEGFGLTMAEAMLLGKPVIATGYSGNLDFMTAQNSLLVDYERVPVARNLPHYQAGGVWAEPSVDHAAHWMRWVFEHQEAARALGACARSETSKLLSLEAAGQRMRRRLEAIRESQAVSKRGSQAA